MNQNPSHPYPSSYFVFYIYVNHVTSAPRYDRLYMLQSLHPGIHPTTAQSLVVWQKRFSKINSLLMHILGKKYVTRSKNVKFCAYSIPHPNDKKVLLQVQVYPGRGSAVDALEQGLRDLHDVSRHIKSVLKVSSNKRRARDTHSILQS